jgi:hypothetical protein
MMHYVKQLGVGRRVEKRSQKKNFRIFPRAQRNTSHLLIWKKSLNRCLLRFGRRYFLIWKVRCEDLDWNKY